MKRGADVVRWIESVKPWKCRRNSEVKESVGGGRERNDGKEGRRKKNRSDDNGERIPLGVRETLVSCPLLSLYIRRISTNEIIKITKLSLRSTNDDGDDDDDERSCASEPLFPLASPPSFYLRGRLCTHPFAPRGEGRESVTIQRESMKIPDGGALKFH